MRGFVAKPIERALSVASAGVDDAIEPVGELDAEVTAVAKRAAVEKRALVLPKTALDAGLCVWFSADGGRTYSVVCGEGEIPRIVDWLLSLPPQHDGFLAIVLARRGAAAEARERALVAVHQGE